MEKKLLPSNSFALATTYLCLPSLLISVSEVGELDIHSFLRGSVNHPKCVLSNPTRAGDEEQLGRRRFWIEEWDGGDGFCCFDGWRVSE